MSDPWNKTYAFPDQNDAAHAPDPWQQSEPATEMMPTTQTDEEKKKYRDDLLMRWQYAQEQAAYWKETEMDLRKQAAKYLVPDPQKNEGMNNIDLGNDWTAKVGVKLNYKLDSDNDKIWATLEKIEGLGNEGKFIAERLISWTPNFLLTEYRQLQEDAEKDSPFAKSVLSVLSEILTISEAAPTLEIKEPKKRNRKAQT